MSVYVNRARLFVSYSPEQDASKSDVDHGSGTVDALFVVAHEAAPAGHPGIFERTLRMQWYWKIRISSQSNAAGCVPMISLTRNEKATLHQSHLTEIGSNNITAEIDTSRFSNHSAVCVHCGLQFCARHIPIAG